MRTINVKTDTSKDYLFASQALEDKGYKEIGKIIYSRRNKKVTADLYEKNGKLYAYKGMYHFNTMIYHVRLGLVHTLNCDYEIVKDEEGLFY